MCWFESLIVDIIEPSTKSGQIPPNAYLKTDVLHRPQERQCEVTPFVQKLTANVQISEFLLFSFLLLFVFDSFFRKVFHRNVCF